MELTLKLDNKNDQRDNKDNVVDRWLDQFKSVETIRAYSSSIKDFFGVNDARDISDWKIKKIKYQDVQDYLKKLFNDGKSDNSIKRNKYALGSFFEYCIDEEIVNENPFGDRRVRRLMKVNCQKGFKVGNSLNKVEMKELINKIDNKRDKILIETMLKTGMRAIEVINIRSEDIKFIDEKWWIKTIGKGNKIRYISVKEELVNELRKYVRDYGIRADEKLFNISTRHVNRIIDKYSDKISAHGCRRSYISGLIRNGAGIDKVQYAAGHASLAVSQRYFREIERFEGSVEEYVDW